MLLGCLPISAGSVSSWAEGREYLFSLMVIQL